MFLGDQPPFLSERLVQIPGGHCFDELYFDVNSTTPLAEGVADAMLPYLQEEYGNPSSTNFRGRRAREAVERAREQLAGFMKAKARDVVFTSGGTESIFAAIIGSIRANPAKRHFITTVVEHPAVLETARFAEELLGAEVSRLDVSSNGSISLADVAAAIRPNTGLISVMYANNETGVKFPIVEIAKLAKSEGILMHTDAVQASGKEAIAFPDLGVSLLSLSGHKFGASKGVGALLVAEDCNWSPIVPGGGQEGGRRGGTECVALIAGLGAAAELRRRQIDSGLEKEIGRMRDDFERQMLNLAGISVNGGDSSRLSNTSSLRISGILATDLIQRLSERGISVSAGAACKAAKVDPSHVLRAMGLSLTECLGTIRVSFGPRSTKEALATLISALHEEIHRLRQLGVEAVSALRSGSA